MKALLVIDRYGWAVDRIALGVESMFPDIKFEKISAVTESDKLLSRNFTLYDFCLFLIPGFLPEGYREGNFLTIIPGGAQVNGMVSLINSRRAMYPVKVGSPCSAISQMLDRVGEACWPIPYGVDVEHFLEIKPKIQFSIITTL